MQAFHCPNLYFIPKRALLGSAVTFAVAAMHSLEQTVAWRKSWETHYTSFFSMQTYIIPRNGFNTSAWIGMYGTSPNSYYWYNDATTPYGSTVNVSTVCSNCAACNSGFNWTIDGGGVTISYTTGASAAYCFYNWPDIALPLKRSVICECKLVQYM